MHEWITTDLRSFKIVLSIVDSARAPLVISHHRWDFPHRWWNMFTFDVTSFDAIKIILCFQTKLLLFIVTFTFHIFDKNVF
jgi:hypothetical protein